ncbi:MAG: isoprenyl transferase [Phycisphaerae bacterium]
MAEEVYIPDALADVPRDRWPRHVAIVMDGNGRWARKRGLPRVEGHRRGGQAARRIVEESARLGLEQLTLYAFSGENWRRPADEVRFLMEQLRRQLSKERATVLENNVRFVVIGRRDRIPPETLAEIDRLTADSAANAGLVLCAAIDYGGRQEIADATRDLARRARDGLLEPDAITEETVAGALYTAGMTDPDLVIRTAGEMRLSNFLLWQISYAELYVTETLWPDFKEAELHAAMRDYASRERRFGGLGPQGGPP